MKFVTDGERSRKWFSFAKKKLLAFKSNGAIAGKVFKISGYTIKLRTATNSANVSAPPGVVVMHSEYLHKVGGYENVENGIQIPTTELGVVKLYYAEPYGANFGTPWLSDGATGDEGTLGDHEGTLYANIKQTTAPYPGVYSDGAYHYTAPGCGVIFPTTVDFYQSSFTVCKQRQSTPFVSTNIGLEGRFANCAKKSIKRPVDAAIVSDAITPFYGVGGWSVSSGATVFSIYTWAELILGQTFRIFITSMGAKYNAELNGYYVGLIAGVTPVMALRGWYVYKHATTGNNARAVFFLEAISGVVGPDTEADFNGAYFIDIVLNPADEFNPEPWMSLEYVGRCLVAPLGGKWATSIGIGSDAPLAMCCGPVMEKQAGQTHRSNIVANGTGGVNVVISQPGESGAWLIDGSYKFVPGAAPVRLVAPDAISFPAEISNLQTWPCILKGVGTNFCWMEKIEASGCSITGLYKGMGTVAVPWVSIPLPTGVMLVVRPVHVDATPGAERIVLVGLVWVATGDPLTEGTFFIEYDTSVNAVEWTRRGKVSATRMLRPKVGVFGAHEFSGLASKFTGSFPITVWAGIHSYLGS